MVLSLVLKGPPSVSDHLGSIHQPLFREMSPRSPPEKTLLGEARGLERVAEIEPSDHLGLTFLVVAYGIACVAGVERKGKGAGFD